MPLNRAAAANPAANPAKKPAGHLAGPQAVTPEGVAAEKQAEYATTETLAEWITPESLVAVLAAQTAQNTAVPAVETRAQTPTVRPAVAVSRTGSAVFDMNTDSADHTVVADRASRAAVRRTAGVRPAAPGRATTTLAVRTVRAAEQAAVREATALRRAFLRRAAIRKAAALRAAAQRITGVGETRQIRRVRPVDTHRRTVVTKHAPVKRAQRVMRLGSGMTAVIAYARSQIGKSYVSGGEGPYGFDCSGFTKRAYAQAGIRLPHSSGAQAAKARTISRAQARPGDLVVGPGHVGIYMGRGMMIDAGNSRTGVVYRKLYSGLRVARL
jgi:cell wall-associated NlpC family hydrolase